MISMPRPSRERKAQLADCWRGQVASLCLLLRNLERTYNYIEDNDLYVPRPVASFVRLAHRLLAISACGSWKHELKRSKEFSL